MEPLAETVISLLPTALNISDYRSDVPHNHGCHSYHATGNHDGRSVH